MPRPSNADGSLAVAPPVLAPTYMVQRPIAGPSGGGPSGSNKPMVSLFNPGGSGKRIVVRQFMVQAETSSGTGVIVLYELRRITAHSAGTALTPLKRDSADPAAVCEAKEEPTVTEVATDPNAQSFIIQANTAQGPFTYVMRFGLAGEKPIVLNEGEGIVAHHVTGNGGIFHVNFVWTEE